MIKKIIYSILSILLIISSFSIINSSKHGGKGFAPTSGYDRYVTKYLDDSSATIYVSSIKDSDGVTISLSSSTKGYFTIDAGQTDVERVICTGTGVGSLTGCTRGLPADGSNETGSSTLAHPHDVGSRIIMSNIGQFYNNYVNIWDNQTKDGILTFLQSPRVPNTTPTDNTEVPSWGIVSNLINQGGATSSPTIAGIVSLATRLQLYLHTIFGADDPHVLDANTATSSSDVATTSVVLTQSNGKINSNFFESSILGYLSPAGSITAYSTTTPPTGWLLCDGSTVSSTTYATLFALIGYTYGGTAGGDFKVPDLRGRYITMASSTRTEADTLGEKGGATTTTLTIPQMPAHTHTITYNNSTSGSNPSNNGSSGASDIASNSTGGGLPHSNLDPFITLNYIIKY